MQVADPFLAVINEMNDDSSKLIYADWLDEIGDPRAEMVRLHVELAGMDDPSQHQHWPDYLQHLTAIYGGENLVHLIGLLDLRHQRLLACRYAEEALDYYDGDYPEDNPARVCIAVSRKFAFRKASRYELDTAGAAMQSIKDKYGSDSQPAGRDKRHAEWAADWVVREAARCTTWDIAATAAAGAALDAARAIARDPRLAVNGGGPGITAWDTPAWTAARSRQTVICVAYLLGFFIDR